MRGGQLYDEVARKAARRLGPPGQIDARAEDQDDYHSKLWVHGLEAAQAANRKRKPGGYAKKAVWNYARNIHRDRARVAAKMPFASLADVDQVPIPCQLDDRIDARRMLLVLQAALSDEDWVLIGALVDCDGHLLKACRQLGWSKSKSEFIRVVLSLRARAREIVRRAMGS